MGRLADEEMRLKAMTAEERSEYDKAAQLWLDDNRGAFEASNRWVQENGMPYAEYRTF
jgi:post-segregation antitoxin (ccd killing protein)